MSKIAMAVLLSAFVAVPAVAADAGIYAGVKFGSADKSVNSVSESNSAWGIFGGYAVNPNFAVEVGYTDLGSMATGLIEFTAFDVSAVGLFPLNDQISLYGKFGLARTTEEFPLLSLSETRTAPTYGLGGQFNVTPSVAIRAGWDRHGFGDGTIFYKGNSNLISVAGVVKF